MDSFPLKKETMRLSVFVWKFKKHSAIAFWKDDFCGHELHE